MDPNLMADAFGGEDEYAEPMMDMGAEGEDEYDVEFHELVKTALPDLDDERIHALKQAIESCLDKRMSGGSLT